MGEKKMDAKELAEKFIEAEEEAWKGNFEPLEQIESPDIVIHMPPAPDFHGFEAHKQYIMTARESTKDPKLDWDYITGDGNVVVMSLKEHTTLTVDNPIFKIPAGTTIDVDMLFVLRQENDRVVEIWAKGGLTTQ
jgi:hypothetical protein